MVNQGDIRALQISFLIPTTISLILKLTYFGYYFSQKDCSNFFFMGCCLGYLLQFIILKLNQIITTYNQNIVCLIISGVCSCCGCTSFIVISGVFLSLSSFTPQTQDLAIYHYCEYSPKLALGLQMIAFALFPMGLALLVADICRTHKKEPKQLTTKEFNFTFLRLSFQAVNEIALMLIVIAFIRDTYWGLAILFSFLLPLFVWAVFVSCAKKAELTGIEVRFNFLLKRDRVDFCTFLILIPLILLSPLFYFVICSLCLMEMWQIQDNNPVQYFYVNINLLLKILSLAPIGGTFFAFTLVEDVQYYFVAGYFAFWLFTLGNIAFPYIQTCRKKGCNFRYVLSTPINTLFTKEEVQNYYQVQLAKIDNKIKKEKQK